VHEQAEGVSLFKVGCDGKWWYRCRLGLFEECGLVFLLWLMPISG